MVERKELVGSLFLTMFDIYSSSVYIFIRLFLHEKGDIEMTSHLVPRINVYLR